MIATIPFAPWQVRATAFVIIGHLGRAAALRLATRPSGLIAPPILGSLAVLGFIQYDDTPVGRYHEMALSPGLSWNALPGLLISHMPVDSERSLFAGRAVWGLPKTHAVFSWEDARDPTIELSSAEGTRLITAVFHERGSFPPLVMPPFPVITLRGPRRQIFTVSGWVREAHRLRATLDVPTQSPFAAIAALVRGPYLALRLDGVHLRLSAPLDLF